MYRWVSFLSDYGLEDAFVGVCHGVIGRTAPDVRVIDITHQVAPQDVEAGAATLAGAVPFLPEAVHLAIVDPGVGTKRRSVAVVTVSGSVLVGPDNGLLSLAWAALGGVSAAYELTNPAYFLDNPSKTFQGRDVFAPVAAHLALGVEPSELGAAVHVDQLTRITLREAYEHDDHVHGEVRSVDHFGNLSLNVHRSDLEAAGVGLGDDVEIRLNGRTMNVPFALTFGEVGPGRVVVCEDSFRQIMIAVNLGHAARTLKAGRGDPVVLTRVIRTATAPAELIGILSPPPEPSTLG